jgi:RNA polymerase sigma-70 factor (ECF subfamily)
MNVTLPHVDPPEPTRLGEVIWLEPYPDVLLDALADSAPGPEARYEMREAISLAFVTALQLLAPAQRAALILRDVLGFTAGEAAQILETSEQSVTSALKRARAHVQQGTFRSQSSALPPPPDSAAERQLVDQLVRAFEVSDVDGIVALMTEDAWLRMPPVPLEYQGRALVARFFAAVAFRQGRRFRLVATRANGQPAFGLYVRDAHDARAHANGLMVLTLANDQISAIDRFDNSVLPRFGLPRTLPD